MWRPWHTHGCDANGAKLQETNRFSCAHVQVSASKTRIDAHNITRAPTIDTEISWCWLQGIGWEEIGVEAGSLIKTRVMSEDRVRMFDIEYLYETEFGGQLSVPL